MMRHKTDRVKRLAAALFIIPLLTAFALSTRALPARTADEDVAALYKAKCAMCHGGKAERYFEPAKSSEALIEATMRGVSPKMPAYATKGMTDVQSKALVEYMKSLRQRPQD